MVDQKGLTEEEFLKQYNPDKYPKPSLTADIVLITEDNEVLLIKRGGHPFLGKWATPGGFANKNEPVEKTAQRELEEETGVQGIPLHLLGVYSKPGRDPRGWTVSVAFVAVVNKKDLKVQHGDDASEAQWFTIKGDKLIHGQIEIGWDDLAFDHKDMIKEAIKKL